MPSIDEEGEGGNASPHGCNLPVARTNTYTDKSAMALRMDPILMAAPMVFMRAF
jgi:hypothetical protein